MVPPRKYVYKELRELAKKFKLPCNLKYEILAKLIRARLHGDHRLVERILNDLRRERTQRRIENTVLRSRIEESGGDPSQLKKVAARRRSNPPAADGAPAGGPPAAAGPLVAANAAGFGPCQTNEPGELMPMDLSLSELVKDSQKRIEIMVELNRATFAIPNVTPGSHVNVESPCQQVRQAARKEKIVNSVQSMGYTVVDNANQMQCMASGSRDAFFRQMHPVAHESQNRKRVPNHNSMAVAQNFHALQFGLPGLRPPAVPVHNVVVQRSTDGSNCARTSVHLAQEFLPPFPLSGSVRPAVGPINAYPPQGSQLVDLDPRHGSHYHHPTITIQSRADVGSQANFSGTYARHELTSSYYCSIPPMPRSSVIVPTPYTNLVKQEYQRQIEYGSELPKIASNSTEYLVDCELSRMRARFSDDLSCPTLSNDLDIGTEVELSTNGDIENFLHNGGLQQISNLQIETSEEYIIIEEDQMISEDVEIVDESNVNGSRRQPLQEIVKYENQLIG